MIEENCFRNVVSPFQNLKCSTFFFYFRARVVRQEQPVRCGDATSISKASIGPLSFDQVYRTLTHTGLVKGPVRIRQVPNKCKLSMHQAMQRSVISSSKPIKAKFSIIKLSFELRHIFYTQAQFFELCLTFSGSGVWDLQPKTEPEQQTGAKPRAKMLAICRIDTFMYYLTNLSR